MAGKYNFTINRGETLRRTFVWKTGSPLTAVNLTGFTYRMTMRPHRRTDIDLVQYLTLRPLEGALDLVIPDTVTPTYDFSSASYDIELEAGDTKRLLKGVVTISQEQTV